MANFFVCVIKNPPYLCANLGAKDWLIFMTSLQSMDQEQLEAAEMDGIGAA